MQDDKLPMLINEPSLSDRTDLDHLFLCDDENWAHLYTKQEKLPIDSYTEAKEKGSFVPKPRSYDVHKTLRKFRRLILAANEHGALNFNEINELLECIFSFIEDGDEDTQVTELKKYLYVVMDDKKYAETLDGSMLLLLHRAVRETFKKLPISYSLFRNIDIGDLRQAYAEVMNDVFPFESYGLKTDDIEKIQAAKDDIKRRFPTLYKIEWRHG
jgi:hypothetical protein